MVFLSGCSDVNMILETGRLKGEQFSTTGGEARGAAPEWAFPARPGLRGRCERRVLDMLLALSRVSQSQGDPAATQAVSTPRTLRPRGLRAGTLSGTF